MLQSIIWHHKHKNTMQTFIRVRVIDTDIGIEEGPRMRPLFFGPYIVTSLFE